MERNSSERSVGQNGNGMQAQAGPANTNTNGKPMKIAYTVTERNGRSFWNRIGVAFVNKDGSINVRLEATPISGQLQIRDWEPRDDMLARAPREPGDFPPTESDALDPPRPRGRGRGRPADDAILAELPF